MLCPSIFEFFKELGVWHRLDPEVAAEGGEAGVGALVAGGVVVKREDEAGVGAEVGGDELGLVLREVGAHEGDCRCGCRLVQRHYVKESFDENESMPVRRHPM